jgi:RHS repeat-associated protein
MLRHYASNYEESLFVIPGSSEIRIAKEYIHSPYGLVAIRNDGALNAVATDHLGSIVAEYNPRKSKYEHFGYDAWGRRYRYENSSKIYFDTISPLTVNLSPDQILDFFTRGYTGHEHLDMFGLINMNGRMYDPVLGRMLSPDPYVPDGTYSQDFNRYSYARNNPLMYTDPTGELPQFLTSLALQFAVPVMTFIPNFLLNLTSGNPNPGLEAWNTTQMVMNMRKEMQVPIYQDENTSVSIRMNYGLSLNVAYTTEDGTTVGAGIGVGMGGPFANAGVSQEFGDFSFGGGVGIGANYWGWNGNVAVGGYGLGYGRTYYGSAIGPDGLSNKQTTGTASIFGPNWSFRLENDFLAKDGDRWRTNAWELSIGDLSLGSSIYTNDPKGEGLGVNLEGENLLGKLNKHGNGAWKNGQVYSSPLWIGYRSGNSISRIGYSNPWVQDRTQNVIHRRGLPAMRQNYYNKYDRFEYGWSSYFGYYNPFSFY